MSGGDSGNSSDLTYPAYGPCSLGGGDGDFIGIGNDAAKWARPASQASGQASDRSRRSQAAPLCSHQRERR